MGKALHVLPFETSDKLVLMSVVDSFALAASYVEMYVLHTAPLK